MKGIIIYDKRLWMEMICQPKIYILNWVVNKVVCFNDLNTPELHNIQNIFLILNKKKFSNIHDWRIFGQYLNLKC